jgi:hypothetical protein
MTLAAAPPEQALLPSRLLERLGSTDRVTRNKAIVELSRLPRHQLAAQDVFQLFQAILAVDEPSYVGQASYILARLPRNPDIVATAIRLSQENRRQSSVVAALVYLEKHDSVAFARYFASKKYTELSKEVREQLAPTDVVRNLRIRHLSQLCNDYLKWRPAPNSVDASNPYREDVVAAGADIVPLLIESQAKGQAVSPSVVGVLGEIGVPESFPYLFDSYVSNPRDDIAVAIGSSWRSLYVEKAFSSLDETLLRGLIRTVLDKQWEAMKGKSMTEMKKYVIDNLGDIIKECKRRSKSVEG